MHVPHGVWTLCTRVWSWDTLGFDFDRLIIAKKIIYNLINVGEDNNNNNNYDMDCFCDRNNAHSDWLILGHSSLVMPTGRLWACRNKMPDHKQLINLERSVFTGKSQTSDLVLTERSVCDFT